MKYQKLQALLLNSKNNNESNFLFIEINCLVALEVSYFAEVLVLSLLKTGFL